MKNWNAPEIQELNLSSTEQHGKPSKYQDGVVWDPIRGENWYTFSGVNPTPEGPDGEVVIGGDNGSGHH